MELSLGPIALAQLLIFPAAACVAISMLGALVFKFRLQINTTLFLEQIRKLVRSGNRDRAVKLCRAVDTPITALTLYGLALEEPSQIFGEQAGDFRQAAPSTAFEPRVRDRLAAAARRLLRRHWSLLLFAGLGALGSGLAGGSWLLERPPLAWPRFSPVLAGAGLLGILLGLKAYRGFARDLQQVANELPSLMVPLEDLDEDGRDSAARAREALAASRYRSLGDAAAYEQPGGDSQQ